MSNISICFVCLNAYPLLTNQSIEMVGGAELQSVLLGKELAKRGFDISFVVLDHGQESPIIVDGIKIIKTYPVNTPKGIRFSTIYPVLKALNTANADIYYGFRGVAGIVALFCVIKRRRLIIGIPSDMEVESIRAGRFNIYNWLWKFDLKMASRVITQTKFQNYQLKRNFGCESVIINAFLPIDNKPIEKITPPIVLWVSTIRPNWKQPELFLQLAKAIPEAKFQMVGGPSEDRGFYNYIKEEAGKITNLDFVGFIPHDKVGEYFEKASIFVNTSDVEGFPNTFLEAWTRYTPVVSLNIDPDEIICQNKLGIHSKTLNKMVDDVRLLLNNENLRSEMGINSRKYVEREHNLKLILGQYIKLFN